MRALFGARPGHIEIGFDFASLEARVQGHYCKAYPDLGGDELAEQLLAEKPQDVHCYSEDTEILTEGGWKTFDALSLQDKVLQYDPDLDESFFVNPLEIVWQPYKGKMIGFKNVSTDMLLTPNHRFLYKSSDIKRDFITRTAEEVSGFSSQIYYKTTSTVLEGIDEYPKEFYELIIAAQADSHFNRDCKAITFSFVKERKVNRLKYLLNSLNVDYSVTSSHRKGRDEISIRMKSKDKWTLLIREWLDPKKKLLKSFNSLTLDTRIYLIESIQYWDGTLDNNGNIVLDTIDFDFVDQIQSLCSISGYKSSSNFYDKKTTHGPCKIKRLYMNGKSTGYKSLKNNSYEISYDGYIGCVAVPSGYITVRRNGRVFISGNTKNAEKLGISRDQAKSISYGLLYGAQAAKLQSMLSISKEEAERLYNEYWDAVPSLKKLKEVVEAYWENTNKRFVKAIDGRLLGVRSKHALLNVLLQSGGSLAMKYSVLKISQILDKLNILGNPLKDDLEDFLSKAYQMILYHDEAQYSFPASWYKPVMFDTEEEASEYRKNNKLSTPVHFSDKLNKFYVDGTNILSDIIEESVKDATTYLDSRVELAIEYSCGRNWADCH